MQHSRELARVSCPHPNRTSKGKNGCSILPAASLRRYGQSKRACRPESSRVSLGKHHLQSVDQHQSDLSNVLRLDSKLIQPAANAFKKASANYPFATVSRCLSFPPASSLKDFMLISLARLLSHFVLLSCSSLHLRSYLSFRSSLLSASLSVLGLSSSLPLL